MRTIKKALQSADDWLVGFEALRRKPKLLILALHTLWRSPADGERNVMHPQQQLTLSGLEAALENFRASGYRFVSPSQVAQGLPADGHHCLVTFDDGYRNNLDALPLLQRFGVPAIFFVVPHHIETGESFWWDAVYRKGRADGKTEDEINYFIEDVKRKPAREVRPALAAAGLSSADFRPVGDLDRPLNRAELLDLAKNELVTLGNHTWGHEILTRCTADERMDTLLRTQRYLEEITGYIPEWVAYPNGNWRDDIAGELAACGLHWGGTLHEKPVELPLPVGLTEKLSLSRYLFWGNTDVERECRRLQLDYSLVAGAKALRQSWLSLKRRGAR